MPTPSPTSAPLYRSPSNHQGLANAPDLICIGNTWTAAKPLQMKGHLTDLDNKVVKADEIKDVKPEPVAFLPRPDRPIVKVAASADAATIQAAIDQAAAMKGKRPVVHLPKANYTIGKMLVIPAGIDLQLVGDGPEDATQLANAGGANPLIRVLGPSHATFHNFLADAGKAAVCIQVANCDQAGARIFGEQLHTPSGMSTVWSPTASRTLVWNYVTIATTASR